MDPITDRWGTWISANGYVLDAGGSPAAVLGTDVGVQRALASFNQIKQVGILLTAIASLLLAIILAQWMIWRYNQDKRVAMRLAMKD